VLRPSIIFAILVSFCYGHGYGQDSELLLLPKGVSIHQVSWHDSIYRFPSFQPGKVTFATGFRPNENILFNHNLFFVRIELINEKGDTVEVIPSPDIKHITIGNCQFDYNEHAGFVEIIVPPPLGLVAVRYFNDEKRDNWPYWRVQDIRNEPAVLDRYYKKVTSYSFLDERRRLRPATKPVIISLFRNHKTEISNYIDDNKIDFGKEQDLVKLLEFCNHLQSK
jgi:hypothetical protein